MFTVQHEKNVVADGAKITALFKKTKIPPLQYFRDRIIAWFPLQHRFTLRISIVVNRIESLDANMGFYFVMMCKVKQKIAFQFFTL